MKAAILENPKHLVVKDIPIPKYSENEVLVRVKEVGLCGSDVHYFNEGRAGNFIIKKPIILGHEGSGIVAEIGKNVKCLKIGDRVSIEPGIPCYKCDYCRSGKYNLCDNIAFLATPPFNGAFTEYIKYDPNFLFKVSENISFTEAALVEPLSVGYNCVMHAKIKPGNNLCILGAGPIGLACFEMAKVMGVAKIFIADINSYRLYLVRKKGASLTINVLKNNLIGKIMENTTGLGADSVIEASGNEDSIYNSLKLVTKGGTVVWVGVSNDEVKIPYNEVIGKGISIRAIFRYKNTYKPVINLLESKILNLDGWVSHRFKLDEIQKAFDTANDPSINKLKIIIEI